MHVHVCNCITPFYVSLQEHACGPTYFHVCFRARALPMANIPPPLIFHSSPPFIPPFSLLLFSSSSGQPFIIRIILEEKESVGGEKTPLSFIFCPFLPLAIWTKICFSKILQNDLWDETGSPSSWILCDAHSVCVCVCVYSDIP